MKLFDALYITQAEKDLLEWLGSVIGKKDSHTHTGVVSDFQLILIAANAVQNPGQDYGTGTIRNAQRINVLDAYENGVRDILDLARRKVSSDDIAKCILFYHTGSMFSKDAENMAISSVKTAGYDRAFDDAHGYLHQNAWNRFWIWGFARHCMIFAGEMERNAQGGRDGQKGLYEEAVNRLSLHFQSVTDAENARTTALATYNTMCFGKSDANTQSVKGSEAKKLLKSLMEGKTSLSKEETVSVLQEIADDTEYEDLEKALEAGVNKRNDRLKKAEEAMYAERNILLKAQREHEDAYEKAVDKAVTIDAEQAAALRSFAMKASDTALSVAEREAASKTYD